MKSKRFNTLRFLVRYSQEMKISPSGRHLLRVLWEHSDEDGRCFVSFGRMAEETGMSVRTCQRIIIELVEKCVVRKRESGNRHGKANKYSIRVPHAKANIGEMGNKNQ